MMKSKMLIIILAIIVISAVIFGIIMAYKTYRTPMYVEDLEKAIEILTSEVENENDRMIKLAMYNELSKSKIMIDRNTNETKKFSNEEMEKIYSDMGGKEAVVKYLESIKDDGERRNKLQLALDLEIITRNEMDKMW